MALNIYPITTTGKKWMWRRRKKKNKEKGIIMRERVIDQRDSSPTLSRLLQPHKNFCVCVCVFVVSARLWVYGSGSAGDKLLSNKEKYKKEKRRKPLKKERNDQKLFFSLLLAFDVFIRSESSVSTSYSCESNKKRGLRTKASWIRIQQRRPRGKKRRRSGGLLKRNHQNACGIAREKKDWAVERGRANRTRLISFCGPVSPEHSDMLITYDS